MMDSTGRVGGERTVTVAAATAARVEKRKNIYDAEWFTRISKLHYEV